MKAAILDSPNSVPVYGDFAEPAAGPDTQVVELVAAGIHHVTRSVAAAGTTAARGYPLIHGLNAVARTADGQLVFTSSARALRHLRRAHRFARRDAFPAAGRSLTRGVAAGINPGMASWLPLQARLAEAGKLSTVLILGVTGISGFLAAQNARLPAPSRRRCGPAGLAWTAPLPRARNRSRSPATAMPTPRPWLRP